MIFLKRKFYILLYKIISQITKVIFFLPDHVLPTYTCLGHVESYDSAKDYFKRKFQRLNRKPDKRVYVHFTDATDTNLLQHVMMAVSDIILNENLSSIMM